MFSLPPPQTPFFFCLQRQNQYFVFLSATQLLRGSLLLPATPLRLRWANKRLLLSLCVAPHTHSAVAASVHMCRIDHQCPRGWWGSPTCGPCDCDVDKGFDPNCNKTNGHCHCKVSHKHTRSSTTANTEQMIHSVMWVTLMSVIKGLYLIFLPLFTPNKKHLTPGCVQPSDDQDWDFPFFKANCFFEFRPCFSRAVELSFWSFRIDVITRGTQSNHTDYLYLWEQ